MMEEIKKLNKNLVRTACSTCNTNMNIDNDILYGLGETILSTKSIILCWRCLPKITELRQTEKSFTVYDVMPFYRLLEFIHRLPKDPHVCSVCDKRHYDNSDFKFFVYRGRSRSRVIGLCLHCQVSLDPSFTILNDFGFLTDEYFIHNTLLASEKRNVLEKFRSWESEKYVRERKEKLQKELDDKKEREDKEYKERKEKKELEKAALRSQVAEKIKYRSEYNSQAIPLVSDLKYFGIDRETIEHISAILEFSYESYPEDEYERLDRLRESFQIS